MIHTCQQFIEDVFYKRKLLNHSLPKYRLSFILDVFETHTKHTAHT